MLPEVRIKYFLSVMLMCREMQRQIPAREAYSMSKTVSGTCFHQSFVSMYPRRGRGTGNAAALSNDICTKILLGDSNTELDTLPKTVLAGSNNFQHGNYIALMFDQKWFIESILSIQMNTMMLT